jgi:hypothetical protein
MGRMISGTSLLVSVIGSSSDLRQVDAFVQALLSHVAVHGGPLAKLAARPAVVAAMSAAVSQAPTALAAQLVSVVASVLDTSAEGHSSARAPLSCFSTLAAAVLAALRFDVMQAKAVSDSLHLLSDQVLARFAVAAKRSDAPQGASGGQIDPAELLAPCFIPEAQPVLPLLLMHAEVLRLQTLCAASRPDVEWGSMLSLPQALFNDGWVCTPHTSCAGGAATSQGLARFCRSVCSRVAAVPPQQRYTKLAKELDAPNAAQMLAMHSVAWPSAKTVTRLWSVAFTAAQSSTDTVHLADALVLLVLSALNGKGGSQMVEQRRELIESCVSCALRLFSAVHDRLQSAEFYCPLVEQPGKSSEPQRAANFAQNVAQLLIHAQQLAQLVAVGLITQLASTAPLPAESFDAADSSWLNSVCWQQCLEQLHVWALYVSDNALAAILQLCMLAATGQGAHASLGRSSHTASTAKACAEVLARGSFWVARPRASQLWATALANAFASTLAGICHAAQQDGQQQQDIEPVLRSVQFCFVAAGLACADRIALLDVVFLALRSKPVSPPHCQPDCAARACFVALLSIAGSSSRGELTSAKADGALAEVLWLGIASLPAIASPPGVSRGDAGPELTCHAAHCGLASLLQMMQVQGGVPGYLVSSPFALLALFEIAGLPDEAPQPTAPAACCRSPHSLVRMVVAILEEVMSQALADMPPAIVAMLQAMLTQLTRQVLPGRDAIAAGDPAARGNSPAACCRCKITQSACALRFSCRHSPALRAAL